MLYIPQKTNAFWKKPALQMIYKSDQIRILDPALTRITAHDWLHLPTKFSKLEVSIILLIILIN